jgi:hypothetical protein
VNLVEQITLVAPDALTPHPSNPRRGNVEAIRESIRENGFVNPILVQASRQRILAGEHRWRAARAEGFTEVPVILLDVDDDAALRILLADNKTADDAVYDQAILTDVLAAVAKANADLLGTGWSTVEYEAMLNGIDMNAPGSMRDSIDDDNVTAAPSGDDDDDDDDDRGTALALLDVSIGEPVHQVAKHDVFELTGGTQTHTLLVCDLMRDHEFWMPFLADSPDTVFMPYPGVYLTFTIKALTQRFVMVQPNHYIAGHVLDKWVSVYGADSVVKTS